MCATQEVQVNAVYHCESDTWDFWIVESRPGPQFEMTGHVFGAGHALVKGFLKLLDEIEATTH